MSKSLRYKTILVLIVSLGALWFLLPTFRLIMMSEEERQAMAIERPEEYDKLESKAIKRGLDLSGGMHLVLEVDDSKLDEDERVDVVDRALEVIRNRVDQFGVTEPVIKREGSKRIIVQLPGLQDPARARRLIGQTAMLEWRLIRQRAVVVDIVKRLDVVLRDTPEDSLAEKQVIEGETSIGTDPVLDRSETEIAAAIQDQPDSFAQDSLLFPLPQSEILPEIPLQESDRDKPFSSYLMTFYKDWLVVHEKNVPRVRKLLALEEAQKAIPDDSDFLWLDEWADLPEGGRGKFLFLVARDEMVSGKNLQNATPASDPNSPNKLLIRFQFNRAGARELSRFTGKNINRFTAIVLDGKIKSYPIIRTKIPDGRGVIEGTFTDTEAKDLSVVLRAGALPADLIPREERTVGPSLGSDSIMMGLRAALLGLALVVLFMVFYYKISGLIASLALILNLLILFGLLAYLGAALTLPGIAGIILTIGMAIDANVLIFERIREELRKAKTIRSAIDAGYDKAFTTIVDANLTTLITAVVLWQFGTGPIKGFATTLSIGILGSMFSALIFSRLLFDLWTKNGKIKKLSI
ncbi:MAG: protein translocase subunit SecD [Candidatus Krumholzibacteriota bacterium]|nr:protein translocase subunit SecD [Candidatus Krumholzibacteriota bacterium]